MIGVKLLVDVEVGLESDSEKEQLESLALAEQAIQLLQITLSSFLARSDVSMEVRCKAAGILIERGIRGFALGNEIREISEEECREQGKKAKQKDKEVLSERAEK